MTETRLLLFVKLPLPGLAKTRLARTLGQERAVALYDAMVRDVLEALDATGLPLTVCHAPVAPLDAYRDWLGRGRSFLLQEGDDLGERMAHALAKAFEDGAERAVLVGGDLPALVPGAVLEALAAADEAGAALAPSGDGGYSLIALAARAFDPGLFRDVPWGAPGVLQDTLAAFAALGRTVRILPEIPDVDTAEDLAALVRTPPPAPLARRTLALAAPDGSGG